MCTAFSSWQNINKQRRDPAVVEREYVDRDGARREDDGDNPSPRALGRRACRAVGDGHGAGAEGEEHDRSVKPVVNLQ